jgi:hypothetical protein
MVSRRAGVVCRRTQPANIGAGLKPPWTRADLAGGANGRIDEDDATGETARNRIARAADWRNNRF